MLCTLYVAVSFSLFPSRVSPDHSDIQFLKMHVKSRLPKVPIYCVISYDTIIVASLTRSLSIGSPVVCSCYTCNIIVGYNSILGCLCM